MIAVGVGLSRIMAHPMADIVRRNNVRVAGSGRQPLMLAHGFGCDQRMWRLLAPAFESDYRVVLFDYVGLGRSDLAAYRPDRYASLDGYAQDVLDICDALALDDVIFVGHSVSSMIGMLAAIRQPDRFAHLVMIGPSPRYLNDDGYVGGFERRDIDALLQMMDANYVAWAHFLAPIVMANPERPELADELEQTFCSTDPGVARRFAHATFFADNRSDLARSSVPALILQCSDDAIAPDAVGEYMQRHLPHGTLRRMRATGHCPQISHPDETIGQIKEYLAEHASTNGHARD